MVALSVVQASNALVAGELPAKLVAVFVGATSGIGEYTLKALAKHAAEPRLYFTGRNAEAGKRIEEECHALNPKGEYIFKKADTSLLRNVDAMCAEIAEHETAVNLLVLSQGTLDTSQITEEDLALGIATAHYARARFISNFLPLLERADALRRVVSIFVGGKDGLVVLDDLQGRTLRNPLKARGHAASLVTLSMEHFAREHPTVSFIHDFPGFVRSKIGNSVPGVTGVVIRGFFTLLAPVAAIPNEESGERHLYLATSARYPAAQPKGPQGVAIDSNVTVARDIGGSSGGGMYLMDEKCEAAPPAVEKISAQLKQDGTAKAVIQDLEQQWERVLGKKGAQ